MKPGEVVHTWNPPHILSHEDRARGRAANIPEKITVTCKLKRLARAREVPAWQARGHEFNPRYHKKKKAGWLAELLSFSYLLLQYWRLNPESSHCDTSPTSSFLFSFETRSC